MVERLDRSVIFLVWVNISVILAVLTAALPMSLAADVSFRDAPAVFVQEWYEYGVHRDIRGNIVEEKPRLWINIRAGQLSSDSVHNLTIAFQSGERIRFVDQFYEGTFENRSKEEHHSITSLARNFGDGLRFGLTLMGSYPDPLNLSLVPSYLARYPTELGVYPIDHEGRLSLGVWANTSEPLSSLQYSVFPSDSSTRLVNFAVAADLKQAHIQILGSHSYVTFEEIPVGNHYLDSQTIFGASEGLFRFALQAIQKNESTLPLNIYLNGTKMDYESEIVFNYWGDRVRFIEAIAPDMCYYSDVANWNLSYVSGSRALVLIDQNSRETIEFLVVDSDVMDLTVRESDVYGNPTYQMEIGLSSRCNVSLGVAIREKLWFLPSRTYRTDDVPTEISDKYTDPTSSQDGMYIDKDDEIFATWNQQVVGNETDLYWISQKLFGNLSRTSLIHNDSYESEYASSSLKDREGTCRHFSRIYAALLMRKEVPVRTVLGTAFPRLVNETHKKNHEWNEMYLPGCGWISIDVTWKEFAVLPQTHCIYTRWREEKDTLRVGYANITKMHSALERSKQVLRQLMNVVNRKLEHARALVRFIPPSVRFLLPSADADLQRAAVLLDQAREMVEHNYVHDPLLATCEACVAVNHAQEEVYQISAWSILFGLVTALAIILAIYVRRAK